MRKLLVVLFILFTSNIYSQDSIDFKKGIDFIGVGTEPFWRIKVDEEKGMFFSLLADEMNIETGTPETIPLGIIDGFTYAAKTEKYIVKVQVIKEECSDGVSDEVYQYSVKVIIDDIVNKNKLEFTGCGYFLADERLKENWMLKTLNGAEVIPSKIFTVKPYITFDIEKNKVGGNGGCNSFFGNAEVRGDKIVFWGGCMTTLMLCNDMMKVENEFLGTLRDVTIQYKIKDDTLYFFENQNIIMEFKK